MKKTSISRIVGLLFVALAMIGCTEEISSLFTGDDDIKAGDPVMFTTYTPSTATTRTAQEDFTERMATFKPVAAAYKFNIEMYEKVEGEAQPTLLGNADYRPISDSQTSTGYVADGTLVAANSTPLYWPGNAQKYGFKAMAGTTTLETDQTTEAKLLLQDRLLGYGFEPLWDETNGEAVDKEDALNFRTSKEWKSANESLGLTSAENYKKIPLYLKHQRSLITIILKAGEGVNRDNLFFDNAQENIEAVINSYGATEADNKAIQPFAAQTTVDYTSSDFGTPDNGVGTTQYTAVVEPHDYLTHASSHAIAEIKLSGQRFTFYASNDFKFKDYDDHVASPPTEGDESYGAYQAALAQMGGYNLEAGKHLVITATLGRGSRKIMITAYVEDWTETVTTSIVDDYGQAGDPIQIKTRQELYDFLNDPTKNKPGNVAIIVPNSLNLEQTTTTTVENEVTTTTTEDTPWNEQLPLNCTLNMAGATFRTDHQVFSTIGASGNLVNGTISVGNTTVTSAVAQTNYGTVKHINVEPKDANGNNSSGKASRAGLVVTNSGTITECTSELPVYGEGSMVGGIAAESVYGSDEGATMPVIDGCKVDARIDGSAGTLGGGIVGKAVGRVTNNTFIYGITLRQDRTNFKNIIQAKAEGSQQLRAYNNSWPTIATNMIGDVENGNHTPVGERCDATIDCQAELADLVTSTTYNVEGKVYLLSSGFSVTKTEGWGDYSTAQHNVYNNSGSGNVLFTLKGNDKTITTDAMLFHNIMGGISDLTVRLGDDLIAVPTDNQTDAIAPLGYAAIGATISNVKVKGGTHIVQAATVGGILVWAAENAKIEDCQCQAILQVWVSKLEDHTIYSGGIVANAAAATITRCVFHNTGGTLFRNLADTYNDKDGINPEPDTQLNTGIFYGGILGGTSTKEKRDGAVENPSVLITDCTSWFSTPENDQRQKGAIVGYGVYDENTNLVNGIATGCQGNWWNMSSVGIGYYQTGMTIEQLIGKRNAVKPEMDPNYDPDATND